MPLSAPRSADCLRNILDFPDDILLLLLIDMDVRSILAMRKVSGSTFIEVSRCNLVCAMLFRRAEDCTPFHWTGAFGSPL